MCGLTYDFGVVTNSNTIFTLNSNRIVLKRIETTVGAVICSQGSSRSRISEYAYTTTGGIENLGMITVDLTNVYQKNCLCLLGTGDDVVHHVANT